MYQYDHFDRQFVAERVDQFREQVARRLAGELSEDEFRILRLHNGLYLQLHAYMLRVAVPYGVLSSAQLRKLSVIARRYDRGYGHFTTRQNIQFNWIKLTDAPDILAELAEVGMHAIQTSGNCVRNVTTDAFAGVARDEAVDPRVFGEILRQWSTLHPEFTYLPRKFKIAITGAPHDRAAVKVHDIGLRLHRNAAGDLGFEVLVGGGLGRTPIIAKTLRDHLPVAHLLSYLEAILRVYNRYGRRDNIYKARIKILVHEVGIDKLRPQIEAEWAAMCRDGAFVVTPEIIAEIDSRFAKPAYVAAADNPRAVTALKAESVAFARWHVANVAAHREAGHAIVTVSLKPAGKPPGDISAEQMDAVADLADRYSHGEIRVTHIQNLVLPHVRQADLPALWRDLDALGLATANIGHLTDIIACPGLDYCALANARSIPLAQEISQRFADLARLHDIGELQVKISGCINACGHHHVGHIGILGVDKHGVENYQITLGGSADENAAVGGLLGPALPADRVVDAIETIVDTYLSVRRPGESFIAAYRRLGNVPFKEAVYGAR